MAEVDIYLKLMDQKGQIEGESLDKQHEKWIEVHSFSWGMNNDGYAHFGGGAGMGKVNMGDISITKELDSSTSILMHHCATGEHFVSATFEFMKAGGKERVCYNKIELEEVFISSVQHGGGTGAKLSESVSMNFAKIKQKATTQEKTGAKGKEKEFFYDLKTREHG